MKATLAVLGLVLFVVLAECRGIGRKEKPEKDLQRKQLLEKLAARGLKKGGKSSDEGLKGFDDLKSKCEDLGNLEDAIEDASLGESVEAVLGELGGEFEKVAEEVARFCHQVAKVDEQLKSADQGRKEAAGKKLAEALPAMQCVNEIAEKAEKAILSVVTDGFGETEEGEFLEEAEKLFTKCEGKLEQLVGVIDDLEEGVFRK
ncbi:uncharacterized protein LOC127871265 [Dreissena polymorpha]|uniref:Uncharacterized protein n=1 Tax=Dreissena polymorpha TaxID=45954 RepID=A0A9D4RQL5_DREPO|nr:uncharacterized protein LOC127871265 [Dreissena polymorpha]KAH3877274.1 hypothetical protein DPMN_001137 [Dreissena polymorpha]